MTRGTFSFTFRSYSCFVNYLTVFFQESKIWRTSLSEFWQVSVFWHFFYNG